MSALTAFAETAMHEVKYKMLKGSTFFCGNYFLPWHAGKQKTL